MYIYIYNIYSFINFINKNEWENTLYTPAGIFNNSTIFHHVYDKF